MSELAQALVNAQKDMPKVEPDKTNPHYRTQFVSLDHLIAKTRPVLNKHGLAILQAPQIIGDLFALRTTLVHVSGEQLDLGDTPLFGTGDMQKLGAALTYARRYAWAAALGICADEDDDAESVSGEPAAGGIPTRETAATAPHQSATPRAGHQPTGAAATPSPDAVTATIERLTAEILELADANTGKGAPENVGEVLAKHRADITDDIEFCSRLEKYLDDLKQLVGAGPRSQFQVPEKAKAEAA